MAHLLLRYITNCFKEANRAMGIHILIIEGMDLGAFDDFLIPLDIDSLAKRIREAARQEK